MAKAKAKTNGRKTNTRTGRIRAHREQSERRTMDADQVAKVHQQISDAVAQGKRLRKEIEARIDRVLRQQGRRRTAHR